MTAFANTSCIMKTNHNKKIGVTVDVTLCNYVLRALPYLTVLTLS